MLMQLGPFTLSLGLCQSLLNPLSASVAAHGKISHQAKIRPKLSLTNIPLSQLKPPCGKPYKQVLQSLMNRPL